MKQDNEEFFVIPASALNLLFYERYFEYVQLLRQEEMTLQAIYNKISDKLDLYDLPNRYSSYESFKISYYHWLKSKIR